MEPSYVPTVEERMTSEWLSLMSMRVNAFVVLDNIDYNSLKHHIKVHTTRDQATAIAIPGRPNTALHKFEDDFYAELCHQHGRVELFVSSKADEIARRLRKCPTGRRLRAPTD